MFFPKILLMDLHQQLKEIKTQLRLSMNGAVSQSMREKGLVYKLNFGVELPRIKAIAVQYAQDHLLAQALWKEDIRECKIMAGLLQPVDSFSPQFADIWVEDIHNIEIAELTSMNLFQRLPYAPSKSFQWIADGREYVQTCGFLTAARLFIKNGAMDERTANEFLDQAIRLSWPDRTMCAMRRWLLFAVLCSIVKKMPSWYAAGLSTWTVLQQSPGKCFITW